MVLNPHGLVELDKLDSNYHAQKLALLLHEISQEALGKVLLSSTHFNLINPLLGANDEKANGNTTRR
jgi:hypothetical protein